MVERYTGDGGQGESGPTGPQGPIQPPPRFMECGAAIGTESMERFLQSFERSARRWEIVVYPALFAFIILAAYGFFLVYSLTHDMRVMAQAIDPRMGEHMTQLAESVQQLSSTVTDMNTRVDTIATEMVSMSKKMNALGTMEPMLMHLDRMDQAMHGIVVSTDMMRQDISVLSRNISRPLSNINQMMPW